MRKIVAVSGGGKRKSGFSIDAGKIDEEIAKLSGKKNPKFLFVPTASSDSESYAEDFKVRFGKDLGFRVEILSLIKEKISKKEIEEKILNTDIVYVGGGNTLKMMKIWRKLGVDKTLAKAYGNGIVLAGASAGAICWFDSGHSNSLAYYDPEKWKFINVRGLGLAKGIFCPHYDGETHGVARKKHFQEMIKKIGGFGIAVDDGCAIEIIDGKYFKVITSKPGAGAYRVYKKQGSVVSEKIEQSKDLLPIGELYKRS